VALPSLTLVLGAGELSTSSSGRFVLGKKKHPLNRKLNYIVGVYLQIKLLFLWKLPTCIV
jgi:hypothetical protein